MGLSGATILQVIPELSAGGAERTVIEVAAALTDAGANALVASEGGRLERQLADAGGELIRLSKLRSKNPLDLRANARSLAAILRERKVDVIHARSRAPAWSAMWAAKQENVPFVTTYHGIYSSRGRLKNTYNSVMARGDVVIANSDFTADFIRTKHPGHAGHIVTIPRGVDIAAFSTDAVSPERIERVRLNWTLDAASVDTLVVLPARLTSWKGHREAIAAANLLNRQDLPPWHMVFVGDAQGRERYQFQLQELIRMNGLDNRVSIVGHCDDMPAALSLADIVIAPSIRPEAFGRVAAEAGAMSRAVVGSDLGGQREVIVSGKTGILIQPGHVGALADAISELLRMDRLERETMGAAARERICQTYTTASLQRATLAEYEKLLEPVHA